MRMIDVSSNNHPRGCSIDWHAVHESGVGAVMIKATEGTDYVNPWLHRDYDGAIRNGIMCGFYHFAHPGDGAPKAQVDHLANTTRHLIHRCGLALDLETGEDMGWPRVAEWARQFMTLLSEHTAWPIVYTNRSWLANLPGAPWGHRLWLASPGYRPERALWAWQSGTEAIPGIPGETDVDQLYRPPDI